MRIYKKATIITGIMTAASFIGAFILNFSVYIDAFWCNALLGVFGSSLLTFMMSVISYRVERRKTFEGFSYSTKAILHDLNKYQTSWSLEEKIDFFLNYHDISRIDWDRYYGDFCFLFDVSKKNIQYIYSIIYQPILELNQSINYHIWHFRWYKDGSGRNEKVISQFIKELEELIIETTMTTYQDGNMPSDDKEKFTMTSSKNKIVDSTLRELNGEYYRLMYGNRMYRKSQVKEKTQ
ncbi:hypothetical protein SDC9_95478 [bioreactor metagenome]|uniref:Uncharacterized protein n=1 Tax=bioreactor metagenome TaxID=1076179 RepID=A0A645A910_9ZZZZ